MSSHEATNGATFGFEPETAFSKTFDDLIDRLANFLAPNLHHFGIVSTPFSPRILSQKWFALQIESRIENRLPVPHRVAKFGH